MTRGTIFLNEKSGPKGGGDEDLASAAEKAGLEVTSLETVTRERRPPHFEVISLIAHKS